MFPIAENKQVKGRVETHLGRNGKNVYVVEQIIDGFSVWHEEFLFESDACANFEERVSHGRKYLHETLYGTPEEK